MIDLSQKGKCTVLKSCLLFMFSVTTALSLAVAVICWYTNLYRDAILEKMELKNGTQTFEWWVQPPVELLMKVRVFNYTNVDEYEAKNATRLRVEEVGPYIYREIFTRENVEVHENGSISYQERRSYEWIGGRDDNEMIRVPNLLLISLVDMVKDVDGFTGLFLSTTSNTLDMLMPTTTFITLPVKQMLWKYHIELIDDLNAWMTPMIGKPVPNKFGLFETRNGTSEDRITIHSGVGDIDKLGIFQRVNGMDNREVWQDDECDRIVGTDGSMFPPNLTRDRNATLNIYMADMCRSFPIRYDENEIYSGMPVSRYRPTADVFTSAETKSSCYCKTSSLDYASGTVEKNCLPDGVFDVGPCKFNAPIAISFPHFYHGAASLLDGIEGLTPRADLHETYFDLHARLSILVQGWSRLQINARVTVVPFLDFLKPLEDGIILPMVWFETGPDELSDQLIDFLKSAYFTAGNVEMALKWGSLFGLLFSISALIYIWRKSSAKRKSRLQVPSIPGNVGLYPSLNVTSEKIGQMFPEPSAPILDGKESKTVGMDWIYQ